MKLRKIRAKEGQRTYTVIDGEPQSDTEMNRDGADILVGAGIYEFEADDSAAEILLARPEGDYERADKKAPEKKAPKESSTAVKPLTTQDIPKQPKKPRK